MFKINHKYRGFNILSTIMILPLFISLSYCGQKTEQKSDNNGTDKSSIESHSLQQFKKIETVRGKKLATLKEVVYATDMEVDGEELFVLDEVVVYVYSLKDSRLLM